MPRRTFNKKTSTTYALVHRPQNDPLIHDADAPDQIFTEISGPSRQKKSKVKQRDDLEEEFGFGETLRDNEGEAAEHGIYYDDTDYDYMQHMRELGGGSGEATWIEAPQTKQQQKAKAKIRLEDALRDVSLEDDAQSVGGASFGGMSFLAGPQKNTNQYQNQMDVPDALSGFQPDMDPRLREILEALDDEAYVDDEDDIFEELAANGGGEVDFEEFEATRYDGLDEEDGWESDDTTKPAAEYNAQKKKGPTDTSNAAQDTPLPEVTPMQSEICVPDMVNEDEDGEWLENFAKAKGESVKLSASKARQQAEADIVSSIMTSSAQFGRKKKRKGALTSSTGFSMTSSALARTEPLSLLDSRFERLAASYMGDLDEEDEEFDDTASILTTTTSKTSASRSSAFGGSQASEAPELMPAGFDSIMNDFLYNNAGVKGRQQRKGGSGGRWGAQTGIQQLEEIRGVLGRPSARETSRSKQKT